MRGPPVNPLSCDAPWCIGAIEIGLSVGNIVATISSQLPMAIGFPQKWHQAVRRATLQPSFSHRHTELSRLPVSLLSDGRIQSLL